MKISQSLTILSCCLLLIACGAKNETKKAEAKKNEAAKTVPKVEVQTTPSQSAILQAQMDAINKAKNVERELMEARAARDKQDKEVQGAF